ncbi:MAG TPA: VIT and VWA domain-containing protein [Kofleriaceae bacterium]|nr:VIT and VWA domain-containing protein [Kofleriaceae bacterium]
MMRRGPVLALALAVAWSGPADAIELTRPMGMYPVRTGPPLAMVDSRIEVTVRGPIVEAVVVQRFRNTGDRATEATYIFPLPADAAVSAMAMQIGSRTIHAAIEPREAAQRRYEAAVSAGVAGALLEQERPDVFTQTVSAIPPGGIVEVALRFDAVARYQAGRWELVLPMVVAPRYVPGTASGRATTGGGRAPDTDRAPDASRVTPAAAPGAGGSTAVVIHFVDPPGELVSPTHELGGTLRDATLSDPHSDHDAIVRWRAPAPAAGWVERDGDGDGGFAAVVVEAPAAPRRTPGAPLRVILAIDRAATTRGDADAVERPVVRALLGELDAADRVRVIGSDRLAWSAPGEALRALDRLWATPVAVFDLTRVLQGARPEGAAIVLISDGLVADDPAAIAAARQLGVAVHAIGIGPAPARGALHQIAAVTGGTVRHAVAGDDPTQLARAVLADIASPPAPLTVTWGTLGAADVEPAVLPRLGAGQAMLLLARVQRVEAANARTRGELFAFATLAPPRAVDGSTTPLGPLARRWARERLGDLVTAGRDRAAVVSHALRYGLVSPYTSLVAIGSDVAVSGGVKHSVAVPVSMPSGMHWQAVRQAIEVDTRGGDRAEPVAPGASPAPSSPVTDTARPQPETEPPPAGHRPADKAAADDDEAPRKAGKKGAPPRRGKDAPTYKKPARSDGDRRRPAKEDTGEQADDDRAGDRHAPRPAEPVATAPPPAAAPEQITLEGRAPIERRATVAVTDEEMDREAHGEQIVITGRPGPRLSAALGGGLAVDHGARGLLALDVRVETRTRLRLGGDAALWLVGGTEPQGRALLTVARDTLRGWVELGLGAGLHVGDGIGPAGALRLGIATPLPWLTGILRYDAALLFHRPGVTGEHAITLGLELSY